MEIDPAVKQLLQRNEALNLFGSMVCDVSYGISFTLYCICARSLRRRLRRSAQRRGALIALGYTTFAIICGTAYLGLIHYLIQMSYVFHRDFPGGPVVYEGWVLSTQPPSIICLTLVALLDWLTLGIQIWRLSILWRATPYFPYVIALPILLSLTCIGVDLAVAVVRARLNFVSSIPLNAYYFLGFAFFAIPALTTIIVTALMVFRLALIRRRHVGIMGDSDMAKQYTGVISMLIESYALDATWSIAIIITYAIPQPFAIWSVFLQSSVNVKIIALFLIVYRASKGRAWQAHTTDHLEVISTCTI